MLLFLLKATPTITTYSYKFLKFLKHIIRYHKWHFNGVKLNKSDTRANSSCYNAAVTALL